MNRKTITVLLAIALILSLAANAALAVMLVRDREDPNRYLYDPNYAIGGDGEDVELPPEETTEPRFQITTQFITLSLPAQLQDRIAVNTTQEDQNANITFTTKGYTQDEVLFSVVLSKEESGDNILGVLKDETLGQWYVTVNVNDISPENRSEEQYGQICALQQCVNDIMIQIQEDQRFIANRP